MHQMSIESHVIKGVGESYLPITLSRSAKGLVQASQRLVAFLP